MEFFSRAFLVFLMKDNKKRRRKQLGKLVAKSRSKPVNLPGAQPLMNSLYLKDPASVFYFAREVNNTLYTIIMHDLLCLAFFDSCSLFIKNS